MTAKVKIRKNPKLPVIIAVLAVAFIGTSTLIFSLASTPHTAVSTSANAVIAEYKLSTDGLAPSLTNIQTPIVQPFTLYGNGLLVCGKNFPDQFKPGVLPNKQITDNLATSKMLTTAQIQDMITRIVATGFLQLAPEYFAEPVSMKQSTIRLSLNTGTKYVLYYNDVPAPAAYTQTLAILDSVCKPYTQPYTIKDMNLRLKRDPQINGRPVTALTSYTSDVIPVLAEGIRKADIAAVQVKNTPKPVVAPTATTLGEVDKALTGVTAQNYVKQIKGKQQVLVKHNNFVYEVSLDQRLPTVSNPLKVDYKAIRPQAQIQIPSNSTSNNQRARFTTAVEPKGVRIVVLVPAEGADPNHAYGVAKRVGDSVKRWYCEQVQRCYNYLDVQVMQGSQTVASYSTCRIYNNACRDTLDAVMDNIATYDVKTVNVPDIDTIVFPAWAVQTPPLPGAKITCGYGQINGPLGIYDAYLEARCPAGTVFAHELGHTFGLEHIDNGKLMHSHVLCGVDDQFWNQCTLDSSHVAQLKASPYFRVPFTQRPYTFIVLDQHPEQEALYRQLANDKVSVAYRSIDVHNDPSIGEWDKSGVRYFYTAVSSDFVQFQGQASPYATLAEGHNMLNRDYNLGLYIHEIMAYRALQNGWNWTAAADNVDWGRIDAWVMAAKAKGKKVIWSEPAKGWQSLQTNAAVQPYLQKWGDTLVPMFATNFENTASGYLMGDARKAASEVAQRYGMPLGESVQSWYFEENDNPNIKGANIPPSMVRDLMKYGAEKNATYYQIEGVETDMNWGSPYMQGVHMFSQQLLHGSLGINASPRVPLYQMWNNSIFDHYYPNSAESRSVAKSVYGFEDQGIAGYVDVNPTPGTVPLYELYSAHYTDHFYTTDWAQVVAAHNNWPYYQQNSPSVKHVGYVPTTQVIGSKAFFQLWNPGRASAPGEADHFYTTDHWQKDNAMKVNYGIQYQYQGIAGYLYSSP